MKIYLNAKSKNDITYTPDWIKISYKHNNQNMLLTLDIQGEIDYSKGGLFCRCKTEIHPWLLENLDDGTEIDLAILSADEINRIISIEELYEIIKNGNNFFVGIYPAVIEEASEDEMRSDIITDATGLITICKHDNSLLERHFEFKPILNIY